MSQQRWKHDLLKYKENKTWSTKLKFSWKTSNIITVSEQERERIRKNKYYEKYEME